MNYGNVCVQGSDVKLYHYLIIFHGNNSDADGKCGRILGVIIFMLNISLKNVSYVVVKIVQWGATI